MKIVIATQVYENYGAHDWDGTGECPQYWKAKGGSEYIIEDVQHYIKLNEMFAKKCEMVIDSIRSKIECNNEGYQETILGWSIEEDDYMSWFEKSQMEYDGSINCPEPRLTIDGELIPRERLAA